jgi:hypothetical protein
MNAKGGRSQRASSASVRLDDVPHPEFYNTNASTLAMNQLTLVSSEAVQDATIMQSTMELVGFNEKATRRRFRYWTNLEFDVGLFNVLFLDLINGQLDELFRKDGVVNAMYKFMGDVGISKSMQDVIMDAEYNDFEKTQNIWVWARESFKTNPETLDNRFKQNPGRLRGGA